MRPPTALLCLLLATAARAADDHTACIAWAEKHAGETESCQRRRADQEARCAKGEAEACFEAGELWDDLSRNLNTPGNASRALRSFEAACKAGDEEGCWRAASVLDDERAGKLRDRKRARSIYRASCDRGFGRSCHALAYLYQQGKGVKRDFKRGAALFDRACAKGDATACQELWMQANEARDGVRAAKYRELACAAGECPSF